MGYKNKEKQREFTINWLKQRRFDWILQNGPCQWCLSWDNLEVDHIKPKYKKLQPSSLWSKRKELRNAELIKCQVLCYACHKLKTIAESIKRRPAQHGNTGYGYGCRCEICKEAQRTHNARRNNKRSKDSGLVARPSKP